MAKLTVGLPQGTRDSKPQTPKEALEGSLTSETSFINDKS